MSLWSAHQLHDSARNSQRNNDSANIALHNCFRRLSSRAFQIVLMKITPADVRGGGTIYAPVFGRVTWKRIAKQSRTLHWLRPCCRLVCDPFDQALAIVLSKLLINLWQRTNKWAAQKNDISHHCRVFTMAPPDV